jgi:hypothetical protein
VASTVVAPVARPETMGARSGSRKIMVFLL